MRYQHNAGTEKRTKNGSSSIRAPGTPLNKKEKGWVWVSAVGVIGLVGFALLLGALLLFSNHKNLSDDTIWIKNKFLSWNDDDWTGFWSAAGSAGGVVDTADIPNLNLRLEMYSVDGHLSGMLAADQICLSVPFTSFLLFEGEASGSGATITAYDSHGGKRNDFVKVKLERDGVAMTVVPVGGNIEWLPRMTRLERDLKSDWIERGNFRGFCTPERHAALRKRFGKSELTDEEKTRVLLK
jgi:hypothetical protein